MLMVLGLSATIANIVSEEKLDEIMTLLNPTLGLALMMVILNLGAPLDYQLSLGAGAFTAIFILSRALGKYSGAYIGAKVTKLPDTVAKHLGLTLLPHLRFLLAFTGIAAAAFINEIIAVLISKKAFEWAGESNQQRATQPIGDLNTSKI